MRICRIKRNRRVRRFPEGAEPSAVKKKTQKQTGILEDQSKAEKEQVMKQLQEVQRQNEEKERMASWSTSDRLDICLYTEV
jgi:uncharacterized membrane protein YdbT with pleckstrin-like domain